MRISPRTALCGIVLHPATHTRSPAMHNAAYAKLGIDAVYCAFDVPPADLGSAIRGTRALGLRQLAVSIPHKLAVMEHLDEIDAVAERIGAVNTVTQTDGRLIGANTDWIGAVHALEREGSLANTRAIVLGAGGAARAVVYGLLQRGARVTILNRTVSTAQELARSLGAEGSGGLGDLGDLPHDVLVNTTRVGLGEDRSPVPGEALRDNSIVMDAVYGAAPTRLLGDAAERGARTIEGKWMLVHQAAEQLTLWTGREAPVQTMAEAFDAADRSADDQPS